MPSGSVDVSSGNIHLCDVSRFFCRTSVLLASTLRWGLDHPRLGKPAGGELQREPPLCPLVPWRGPAVCRGAGARFSTTGDRADHRPMWIILPSGDAALTQAAGAISRECTVAFAGSHPYRNVFKELLPILSQGQTSVKHSRRSCGAPGRVHNSASKAAREGP